MFIKQWLDKHSPEIRHTFVFFSLTYMAWCFFLLLIWGKPALWRDLVSSPGLRSLIALSSFSLWLISQSKSVITFICLCVFNNNLFDWNRFIFLTSYIQVKVSLPASPCLPSYPDLLPFCLCRKQILWDDNKIFKQNKAWKIREPR